MNHDATIAARLLRDFTGPFDRRQFLRAAAAAGLAAGFPGIGGARADIPSDQKARDQLKQSLTTARPYAVVKNMDFSGATLMGLPDLEQSLEQQEFMHRDHVKFFTAFANSGKIAYRKPTGELNPANGAIVWTDAAGLPPGSDAGYFLSVRRTGRPSITRIGQGNPTKPHAILDKSLTATRLTDVKNDMNDPLAKLPGATPARLRAAGPHQGALDGMKLDPTMASLLRPTGARVTDLIRGANQICATHLGENSLHFGLVGWWVTVELQINGKWTQDIPKPDADNPDKTVVIKVPLGFLRLGEVNNGKARSPKGVPVSFLDSDARGRSDGYTGDYDLHDAYLGSAAVPARRRSFVSSPHTDVVTAAPDRQPDETEYDTFTRLLNWSIHRTRTAQDNRPPIFDGYANLVQHGAQNTYFAFITELSNKKAAGGLSKDDEEELVAELANWDPKIAFFANDRLVYTFDNSSPLKRFHQMYNLANCNNASEQQMWSNGDLKDRLDKFAQRAKKG